VIRVAKAGKHAICEKPMAVNAKEGQEMIDACKQARVKLLVGYRMHFEPKTLEVIRMRKAGEFGKVPLLPGIVRLRQRRSQSMEAEQETIGGRSDDGHRHLFDQWFPVI